MKIGVITFHRAINYGALLQTYALQTTLKNLGADNEVIDYRHAGIEEKYYKVLKKQSLPSLVRSCMLYPREVKKAKKFGKFISSNLKVSNICYKSYNQLEESNSIYDCFITGSDQVWNNKITDMDGAYFLNFVKNSEKKCSYAASFGMYNLPTEQKNLYKTFLSDFNHMSVREEQGKNIIKSLTNKDIQVVLDPTLLLSKDQWCKIAQKPQDNNYILIYIMKWSDSLFKFAEDLSAKTGCKIKYITTGVKKPVKGDYITTAGIEEFVGLFANAKYVVTNSFHGTAFSLIMNKNFFLELLQGQGANDRLENIMDTYNLRSREIVNGKNSYINENIDYEVVNEKLEANKQNSLEFLKKIVNK